MNTNMNIIDNNDIDREIEICIEKYLKSKKSVNDMMLNNKVIVEYNNIYNEYLCNLNKLLVIMSNCINLKYEKYNFIHNCSVYYPKLPPKYLYKFCLCKYCKYDKY